MFKAGFFLRQAMRVAIFSNSYRRTRRPRSHSSPLDHSLLACGARRDLDSLPRQQVRKPLAPFDQNYRLALEDFIQAQGRDLGWRVEPVQVDMVDASGSILVDQGESGT